MAPPQKSKSWECYGCGWTHPMAHAACHSCQPQQKAGRRSASRPREASKSPEVWPVKPSYASVAAGRQSAQRQRVRAQASSDSGWIDYGSRANQRETFEAYGWSSPCSYAEAVAGPPRKAATPEQATRVRAQVPAPAEERDIATPHDAEASAEEERRKQLICTIESSTACAASLKTLQRNAPRDKQIRGHEEDIESAKHALTRMQPASAQRVTMERTRLRREAVCEKCSQEVARLDEEIEERHVRREAAMLVWEAAKSKLQLIDDSIAAIPSDEEDDDITEPVCNGSRATVLVASLSSGNAPPELLAAMAQAYVAAFPQGAGSGREEEDVDMREPIAVATAPKRRADQLTSQHRVEQIDSDNEIGATPQGGALSPCTPSDEQVLTALVPPKKARVLKTDQVSVFHEALPRAEEG